MSFDSKCNGMAAPQQQIRPLNDMKRTAWRIDAFDEHFQFLVLR